METLKVHSSDTPPPSPLILITSLGEGRYNKIKKGWKYVAGAALLKRGAMGKGGGGALFLFNFYKDYHFHIQELLYPLQNCVMHFYKKIFFSAPK